MDYQNNQNGWQQPPQNQQFNTPPQQPPQQPSQPSNGLSIAALVCGILGIVGGFIPVVKYFTLALAVVGIVFGALGQKKAKETGVGSGFATAGLVCGIIGASFSAVGVICALACVGAASGVSKGFLDLVIAAAFI